MLRKTVLAAVAVTAATLAAPTPASAGHSPVSGR